VYTDNRPESTKNASEEEGMNLVFLPGAQITKEVWEYMIELSFNYFGSKLNKCISVDQVHVGDSYKLNDGKLTGSVLWSDCAKDTIKVVKELNLKGPTIAIGHSMSGTIALFCAHYEPFLFDSLVVIDPVIFMGDREFFHNENVVRGSHKVFSGVYRQARNTFKSRSEFETFHKTKTFAREFHPRVLESHLKGIAENRPDGSVAMKAPREMQTAQYMSGGYSMRGALAFFKLLDLEVLHIAPEVADWNVPTATPAIRDTFQYCTPADIVDGGHNCPYTMPDETFAAMKDFIERRHKRGVEILSELNARRGISDSERKSIMTGDVQKELEFLREGKRRFYAKL
jgi:pimeloyl-ACP methyl ester carboxylesterase